MIEVVAAGNAGLMTGLRDRMGQGGAARARLYSGTRSPTPSTPLIALVLFADVTGIIDPTTGDLLVAEGVECLLLQSTAPTWAQVFNGNDEHLFNCDARTTADADTGQELVIAAPAGLYAGALVKIQSGTLSARP
ncbi:MAG: hypothetical protein K2W33_05660 [Burkholderiales bacterium]|nr:hypothetical protein [Burkholderiales bacterium]